MEAWRYLGIREDKPNFKRKKKEKRQGGIPWMYIIPLPLANLLSEIEW